MELTLQDKPDESSWREALALYRAAFPAEGRKPEAILARMFEKRLGVLAAGSEEGVMKAMAVCGVLAEPKLLLIDYLAVRAADRGRGAGTAFVSMIADWAKAQGLDGLLIEAEAEDTPENEARIRFWEKCGFARTAYVHQYIWVPEPYRAMVRYFEPGRFPAPDGMKLFKYISEFHRRSFR
ncbi:GNAT family N-acetyltransferase [Cohnella rhizosphaerae]|uniref:GNAT family N-acetyltransferase n=1 Tax=Cohnella rhizosphaerae TaxID=1457232 RepID=A0A9X4KXZ7_9BACL|nr:GNAT family N-acetyltransferase [Cohnella rhizosphaerae]MDG0812543.1 GNAT family N-acetyltransferase [Cohnella rhizosphaerae]